MPEFPETSDSLIVRVQKRTDQTAWTDFERLYRPVIFRCARAKGLSYADAMDVVQQVLMSVANAIGHYEKRDKSVRFRHWMSRITRNAILKAVSRRPRDRAAGGTDGLTMMRHFAEAESEELIELEYRRELFRQAADHVRANVQEQTWLSFEMTVLQGKPIEEVAGLLSKTAGSVYAARSRIVRRLRDAVQQIERTLEQSHNGEGMNR